MDSETNNALEDDPLILDKKHGGETHKRWLKHLNRRLPAGEEDVPDDWINEQCGGCRFYILLRGYLGSDWGVCSNAASEFDGHVMFEHDGCENYSEANSWVSTYLYDRDRAAKSQSGSG